MIELINLTKWYPTKFGRKYVLRNVSLTIPSGLNIAVLGRNGAGKSTFMRILGGSESPDRGRVRVTGSISWPMGLSSGFLGSMSGRENTRFIAGLYGLDRKTSTKLCGFVQEFSELGRDYELPLSGYSSGMRSRLTFAVCMGFEFDYYLMDELTAVGDDKFKLKSKEALLARKGRANYLMSGHNVDEMMREADCALLIENTQVYYFSDTRTALETYKQVLMKKIEPVSAPDLRREQSEDGDP